MPKSGHTEEQIVAVLRHVEAGARVGKDLHCPKPLASSVIENGSGPVD